MSYLDDPRVLFAAERTLLAWQRTAIALIGLGFVVERFGLFLRLVSGGAPLPAGHAHVSLIFGIIFLVSGAMISAFTARQFQRFVRELSAAELPRNYSLWLGPAANFALAIVASCMAMWFVVTQ